MPRFYIGRQAILDAYGNTYGYELLFRASQENTFDPSMDGDSATASVLVNAIVEAGFDSLVGNSLAFINCTNRFLENPDLLELLPADRCVLEVLETVDVNDELVAGICQLRNQGFTIALDDFSNAPDFDRLIPLANIIKYDITDHSRDSLHQFLSQDKANGRESLVERVETQAEFIDLKKAGFDYFQGYFFAKPTVISGSQLPPNKLTVLQLLAEINNPDSTIDDVARIVSRDASLGIRTLRYVNSPITGLSATVNSVRHATILLGRATIRNWISLMVMTDLEEKPAELIKLALTRARFCQLVAIEENLADDGMYFTIGLLSLIDVLTDTSLDDALSKLALNKDLVVQMTERSGVGGYMLNTVELLESPDSYTNTAHNLDLVMELYQSALQWTEQAYLISPVNCRKCA